MRSGRDSTDFESDEQDFCWVSYFLSKQENDFFCRIDESYLHDSFNLHGIQPQIPYYDWALDLICDVSLDDDDQDFLEEHQQLIENDADVLYGLVHARFILTNRGMQAMLEKYRAREFGDCPHVYCKNTPLLPYALTDEKNKESVKLYCPCCERVYRPKRKRYESIDGAYFGTTFCPMFFLTFPQLKPKFKQETYTPLVYGFKIHPDAYDRQREAIVERREKKKERQRKALIKKRRKELRAKEAAERKRILGATNQPSKKETMGKKDVQEVR